MTGSSNSQLYQDIFAFQNVKNKTYIEIGAAAPIKINNTYLLEQNGFNGISLEFNEACIPLWNIRKNKIYFDNAITFNYTTALKENNLPTRLGYLSCDIEPPANTFAALKQVIEQDISFDCITFEHDKYQSEIDFNPIVTEYLTTKGYKVAVRDVYRIRKIRCVDQKKKINKKCFMETWFVHTSINFTEQTFDEWKHNQGLL